MPSGTATIDFGSITTPSATTSVVISSQATITENAKIDVFVKMEATTEHSIDEVQVQAPRVRAGEIIPGESFTIFAEAFDRQDYGTYTITWTWTDATVPFQGNRFVAINEWVYAGGSPTFATSTNADPATLLFPGTTIQDATYAFWIRFTGQGPDGSILEINAPHAPSADQQLNLYFDSGLIVARITLDNEDIVSTFVDPSAVALFYASATANNTWYLVAVSVDTATHLLKLQMPGFGSSSVDYATGGGFSITGASFSFGSVGDNSTSLSWRNLAAWNRCLSSSEIDDLSLLGYRHNLKTNGGSYVGEGTSGPRHWWHGEGDALTGPIVDRGLSASSDLTLGLSERLEVDFETGDQYISLSNSTDLYPSSPNVCTLFFPGGSTVGPVTMGFWFKGSSANDNFFEVYTDNGGDTPHLTLTLVDDVTTSVQVLVVDDAGATLNSVLDDVPLVVTDSWHFLAFSLSPTQLVLKVDQRDAVSATHSLGGHTFTNVGDTFFIRGSLFPNWQIRSAFVAARIFSVAELTSLAQAGYRHDLRQSYGAYLASPANNVYLRYWWVGDRDKQLGPISNLGRSSDWVLNLDSNTLVKD